MFEARNWKPRVVKNVYRENQAHYSDGRAPMVFISVAKVSLKLHITNKRNVKKREGGGKTSYFI